LPPSFAVLLKEEKLLPKAVAALAVAWHGLPTGFPHTRYQTIAGQIAEANAADAELALDGAGPAADLAAALDPNAFARQHLDLVGCSQARLQLEALLAVSDILCSSRHGFTPG
jgi:outer membrane murein-binding lipoprotein Lpp